MSAHAGGMCMSQCKHWRIPLFLFRRAKKKCMRILSWVPEKSLSPSGMTIFLIYERIRIMSAHAGGVCMSQCEHRRIPLFLFRRAKKKCMRILSWETSEEACISAVSFFLLKIGPASLGSDFFRTEYAPLNIFASIQRPARFFNRAGRKFTFCSGKVLCL